MAKRANHPNESRTTVYMPPQLSTVFLLRLLHTPRYLFDLFDNLLSSGRIDELTDYIEDSWRGWGNEE